MHNEHQLPLKKDTKGEQIRKLLQMRKRLISEPSPHDEQKASSQLF